MAASSSLQAQLAALHHAGTAGSVLPAAQKRPEEALGRGLHYSVQQGHATSSLQRSTTIKASLLYATAKQAAQVPLETLREKSLAALHVLSAVDDTFTSSSSYMALWQPTEESLASTAAAMLSELLVRLTRLLGDTRLALQQATLEVLEFLLRRFQLETSDQFALDLLWVFLPHHAKHPHLLHRCLQLLDLVALGNSYLWLRPFAVTTADASSPPPVISRAVLVQHVVKNVDLLRRLCHLVATATRMQGELYRQQGYDDESNDNNAGWEHLYSWSAACTVEGLAELARQGHQVEQDERRHAALRVLVPAVRTAARCSVAAGRAWAAVVASAAAEALDLSDALLNQWATDLVHGALIVAAEDAEDEEGGYVNDNDDRATATAALVQAWTAVLSLYVPADHVAGTSRPLHKANALPLLPVSSATTTTTTQQRQQWLGIPLSRTILDLAIQTLRQHGSMARIVAHMHAEWDVTALAVTLVMQSLSQHLHSDGNDGNDEDDNARYYIELALDLLSQSRLQQSLWKGPRLVASLTAWWVQRAWRQQHETSQDPISDQRRILKALRQIDGAAWERGLAHAMTALQEEQEENENVSHQERTAWLAQLLQGLVVVTQPPTISDDKHGDDVNMEDAAAVDWHHLLPPRVALEHAQARVRLAALKRLLRELEDQENNDDGMSEDDTITGESMLETLLRRWSMDDDVDVATAASRAVLQLWESLSTERSSWETCAQLVWTGWHRWSNATVLGNDKVSSSLALLRQQGLTLAGFVLQKMSESNQEGEKVDEEDQDEEMLDESMNASSPLWRQLLLELLVAQLWHNDNQKHAIDELETSACRAICVALQGSNQDAKDTTKLVAEASRLVLGNEPWLDRVSNAYRTMLLHRNNDADGTGSVELILRQQCAWVILSAMVEDKQCLKQATMALYAWKLCVVVLSPLQSFASEVHIDVLARCLERSAKTIAEQNRQEVPNAVIQLASIPGHAHENLVRAGLLGICKHTKDALKHSISSVAVLMEAALRAELAPGDVVRLVSLASECVDKDVAAWLGVVPALALLEADAAQVRAEAVSLLLSIGQTLSSSSKKSKRKSGNEWKPVVGCWINQLQDRFSTARLGGSHFLAGFLASEATQHPDTESLRDTLLKLTLWSAACVGCKRVDEKISVFEQGWLPAGESKGSSQAATILLDAMETAGEKVFPLATRWKLAGLPIVQGLMHADFNNCNVKNDATVLLADRAVRVLKGVTVVDSGMIVSSGPGAVGRRSRSYSVGSGSEGLQSINQYPQEMQETIIDVLGSSREETPGGEFLATLVIQRLLTTSSWGMSIFVNLPGPARKQVASALLNYFCSDEAKSPGVVFGSLALNSLDVKELLLESTQDGNLVAITILMDFIRANADRLGKSADSLHLVGAMFNTLQTLSSAAPSVSDTDGLEFTCQAIVLALQRLAGDGENLANGKVTPEDLSKWVETLLALQNDPVSSEPGVKATYRTRSAALSLMSMLTARYPKQLMGSLLETATSASTTAQSGGVQSSRNLRTLFSVVVPIFWSESSTDLAFTDLLNSMVSAANAWETGKDIVFRDLVEALLQDQVDQKEHMSSAGALAAVFLASQAKNGAVNSDNVREAVQIISFCPLHSQVSSLVLLLQYAKSFVSQLLNLDAPAHGFRVLPSHSAIAAIALADAKSSESRKTISVLLKSFLQVVNDSLLLDSVRRTVRKSQDCSTTSSLQMWQDLLAIHYSTQSQNDSEATGWKEIADVANESRECLQSILPADIFLASVTSLIKEGGTTEIRARALRLAADRVVEMDPAGGETSLYEELVPEILQLLRMETKPLTPKAGIIIQSSLVAIEHIARSLYNSDQQVKGGGSRHFVDALSQSMHLLTYVERQTSGFHSLDSLARQLLSSVALTTATLIRVTGVRSLPHLPKVVKPLSKLLAEANSSMASSATADDVDAESLGETRLLQLSLLRTFIAIVETVPQFIPSHLPLILTSSVLLSQSLRDNDDGALTEAVDQLDEILPNRVPPRLFIPAVSKAIAVHKQQSPESRILLSMLKLSIGNMSSGESSVHRDVVLSCITSTCEQKDTVPNRKMTIRAGIDVLLALILKLNEVQLRRLYAALREWRGDFDVASADNNAEKRYAFWTISAALAKELRSIFLPCMGTVVGDAVAELQAAAAVLTQKTLATTGSKKRKLSASSATHASSLDVESARTLQPLLHCLELALSADAHDGGNWVRSDEGNGRYEALLEPLGKLLQAKFAADFPIPPEIASNSSSAFAYVVEGVDNDEGSVVASLTALGAAAGDEQLWKPLNHLVLQACGNDDGRKEVTMAGLVCLDALIEALGEEYMVLLPECLPVLSELLEDTNEDIADLARDIVSKAEELIGESLEDSLR